MSGERSLGDAEFVGHFRRVGLLGMLVVAHPVGGLEDVLLAVSETAAVDDDLLRTDERFTRPERVSDTHVAEGLPVVPEAGKEYTFHLGT